MNSVPELLLGTVFGAVISAGVTVATLILTRADQRKVRRRDRVTTSHLDQYQSLYAAARTAKESLSTLLEIGGEPVERQDEFLETILSIARADCYQFAIASDWRHNHALAFLDSRVEDRCLGCRKLVLDWLSIERLVAMDRISVREGDGDYRVVDRRALIRGNNGDPYGVILVETLSIVVMDDVDESRTRHVIADLERLLAALKDVIAY